MPRVTPLPPRPDALSLGPDRAVLLGELVGRGSCSVVYRGTMEGAYRMRRPVAVKIFDPLASEERDQVVSGLARATRHAACVRHPNVASPEEFVLASPNQPAVLSEWIDGVSLERFIEAHAQLGERMTTSLALFIALEVAEGLAGARDAFTADGVRLNMGHHSLSAREVMLSRQGEVKITDFGISLAMRPASAVLHLRAFAKRVSPMSPEVARGSRGDARSDVFSLGMLLREMLVGPRFAPGSRDSDVLEMLRDGAFHSSPLERPLHESIAPILRRAIEIEPRLRYPHAGLLANDLRRAIAMMGVGDERTFLRRAIENRFGSHGLDDDDTEDFDKCGSGARRSLPQSELALLRDDDFDVDME
ncbi:MAG: protein kinase [Polyangiaceae bacterium]